MRRLTWIGLVVLLAAGSAAAGGAEEQHVAGKDLGEGTFDGLALDAEQIVRPGLAFTEVDLDVPTTWAAVRSGTTTWVATGNDAQVLRVDAKGAVTRIETGEGGLMVTALAPLPDQGVAAAVYPGGRVLRISAQGKVTPLATLPVEFVWALASDKRGALTAACGGPGIVVSIDPFGAVEKRAEVHDEHARCLTVAGDRVLVGTAPKGLVLELQGETLRVVRDLTPQEVVGLVVLEDGSLIVAANHDVVGGNARKMAGLLRQITSPSKTAPGQKPAARAAMQNGRILHLKNDGGTDTLWEENKVAVLSVCHHDGGVLAGTQPEGRVLGVWPGKAARIVADVTQSEASVVIAGDGGPEIATSNPGVLHRVKPATTGTWTSAPLDPEARARWGAVRVLGDAIAGAEYRYGETEEPDDTWSPWTPVAGFDGERGDTGVTSRYIQFRVTLSWKDATLQTRAAVRAVQVVRRTPNRTPELSKFATTPLKPNAKTGLLVATPRRTLTWKPEDPDGDRLHTTLRARRHGSPRWSVLVDGKVLAKPSYTWDTTGWPDGIYRVELIVSDAPSNPGDRAAEARAELPAMRVDNTPPRITLSVRPGDSGSLVVSGALEDVAEGRIAWARVAVDGGPWIPMGARDGLYDTGKEHFDATLPGIAAGEHDVVVQAADTEGNLGTAVAVGLVTVK